MKNGKSVADVVLTSGRIYTVDPGNPWAEALAIRNGKLVFVGADKDVRSFVGSETHVVDLKGKMVMPGINDVHTHPLLGGRADLYECHWISRQRARPTRSTQRARWESRT